MPVSPDQVKNNVDGLHATTDKLLIASSKVAAATGFSRVLGLLRDISIATVFGANATTDAFFIAFKLPNLFRRMFAEGSFTQGFIPILNEYKEQRSLAEVQNLIARVAGTLGAFLFVFTGIGMLLAYWIIFIVAPGFWDQPTQQFMATDMLRITFPYLLLIALTALAAGVLNTYQSFAIPAITPAWLNLCMIVAAFVLAPRLTTPIYALAWAVLVAGVIQLLFLMPSLQRRQLLLLPQIRPKDEGVRRVINLMLPAMFGAAVSQINLLVDLVLASFLVAGSISWLYYSDRLVELPLGLFGVGIATVALPALSSAIAARKDAVFQQTLNWAIRMIFVMGAAATVALIILSEALLTTLFHYGQTTALDVRMSALSLNAYAVGLLGFMLAKTMAAGFFAHQNTRTPVRIGVLAVAVNICLSLILIGFLAHAGLALATSIASLLQTALLFRALIRHNIFRLTAAGWRLFFARLLGALLAMSALLLYLCPDVELWLAMPAIERVLWLAGICIAGALVYCLTLLLLGFRPQDIRRG